MKNAPLYRRLLSVALVIAMIASFMIPAASAKNAPSENQTQVELGLEPIDPGTLESQKLNKVSENTSVTQEDHKLTDVVRVSIVLNKASTLEAGFKAEGIANNAAAMAYREGLRAEQKAMTAAIEKKLGSKLDVKWNMTLAANFISANVLYGQIDTIKAIPGVKDVILENRYEPQEGAKEGDEPNNGSASYMIGSNITWANGYTGAGSKVAVIDTGADSEHQSFSGEGLEYAFAQTAAEKGMTYDEYVATLNLLTPEAIEAVKDQLNASIGSGEAAYRNTKIGYGYNYVDDTVSYIEHINDSQGEHGSHVSGIATGNRFIKVGDEYKPALEAVGTQGVAPDAQLVVMKVFGKGGGAYDSDYMVAIEDAIILGCDSANLSLGSGSAGFSFSGTYENVMNELVENGLVVAMSAGNSYGWYDTPYNSNMYAYLYMDDVNYATGGSPGSFTNALTVASVDNMGQTGYPLLFGDLHVFYSETSGYGNNPISTLAGQELEYVYFDNFGADGNGNSLLAPYADAIAGKVVLCSRGTSSFYQKVNAAAAAGAVACIIYNNQAGVINMNLTGVTTNIPAVSILQSDGLAIKAQSEAVTAEDGTTYYTGTMTISAELEVSVPEVTDSVTVSSFSSYGMPGTLVLKPEILAPGGSIYSVNGLNNAGGGHDQYEIMSGTSMASPQVAGMAAVMGQYIRDNDLVAKTGLTTRQLTNSLLMSTAHPVFDSYGEYYPVFRVGAGLGKVSEATAAQSYILMDEEATMFPDSAMDGKVKAELGDDPDRTGEYTFKFTVNPFEGTKEFTLRTDLFVQDYAGNGGYGMLQYSGTTSISNVIGYFGMSDPGYDAWYEVNGETYENTYMIEADVNKDGETNSLDAQAILDYVAGKIDGEELDLAAADVDGDKAVTTYDAHLILEAAATPTITAEGPTEVTVHLQLTPTAKMVLDYLYGATYIEGYTFVDPVADEEGAMDVVHSIPILAFYGSWTDASMLDRTSVIDEAYGTGKLPYIANTNINYLTMKTPDGDTVVYMGNPYMVEETFPADRLAMNSAATLQSFTYMPIRNNATQGFAILDAEGNVLYSQATASNKYAPYYYVNGGAWQNTGVSAYNIGKTLASAGAKEGDVVNVGFYLLPEYYGVMYAKMNDTVATTGGLDNAGFKAVLESGIVGEGAGVNYTVTVDDTAPVVKGALQDLITGDIYVKAQDNLYIAYVAITNKSGSQVYFETVPEQKEPGEEVEVPLELEGVTLPKDVVLLVGDYAGNEVAFKVNLGGNGGEEESYAGQMFGFVPAGSTVGPGSGNRVWTIDPATANVSSATSYTGVEKFAETSFTVTAAEYVDGYVFMAADDGWFYAAAIDELGEASLAAKYGDTVEKIYDMAYNYKNETMYVLGNDNTIYAMDDLTNCNLIPVCTLVLPGTSGTAMEANRLAIDDNGTFWIANYGTYSNKASLFKLELPEEEEPEEPSELGDLLVSWGFESADEFAEWTTVDANGDGKTWTYSTSNPHTGSGHIYDTYCSSSTQNDDWAISPAFDLSDADGATLKVSLGNNSTYYSENFALYAGTSPEIADMVEIMPETNLCINTYQDFTADLSAFAGEAEVYVAIRHFDVSNAFYAFADDVEIYTTKEESEEPGEPEPVEIPEFEPELVGVMGVNYNYSLGGAFAWDHNEGILYLVTNYNATNDTDHHLWTVNTETGVATKANNAGSLLRASVRGLFIVPGRNPAIHPTDEATGLIVEPEVLELLRGQSDMLKVAVLPWTLTDKDVTFESADPDIASVKDGVVTGNNVGETTITVTTVAEPNLTAEVTVIVSLPPAAELRGVIWDENGKGMASVFDTNATTEWTGLAQVGQLRWGALVGDTVYGSTDDTMYAFDADTYEVTELGGIVSMWIPSDAEELPQDYRDAFAEMGYNVGPVIGPNNNGTYLTMLDPEAGSLIYFDFSDTFGSDPMALITYHHREDYEYIDWSSFSYVTDPDCAVYYMMTESGALYSLLLTHDGSAAPTKIADTGLDLTGVADATNQIWGSMKYDEENDFLYIALFNGGDYANLYAIDASDPSRMSCTGDFNESVWPVTGLYEYEPLTDLFMSVNPTEIEIFETQTAEINVKIKMGETNEYTAEIADPTICSFEDGVVTGLKEGETDITITTVDVNEAGEHLTETVHVTVKPLLALDLTVKGQVTDAKGARFTTILLDGPVAAPKGPEAPFDVKSGARIGDVYVAGDETHIVALDAETFESTDAFNPDPEGYFSQYPAMDIANYPYFTNADGEYDTSKALFTTNLGWIVKPDYYGWNLSSYIPDMAGIAFGGVGEDGATYIYYILTTAGALYEIDVDYAAGSLSLGKLLDTGITVTDQSALSMAFAYGVNVHYTTDNEETYGLVVANNEDKTMWFIDFQTGDVGMVGTLDADNVSGLYGYYDDMVAVDEGPAPVSVPEGDVFAGFYFEEDPAEAGWTFYDDDEDGYTWTWNQNIASWFDGTPDFNSMAYEGTGAILSGSYINTVGALSPDNWAFSPAIDLSEAEGDLALTFYADSIDTSYPEKFAVYVQVVGEEGMTQVLPLTTTKADYTMYSVDLNAFKGETISIGFRNYSTNDMYLMALDQVEVLENVEWTEGGTTPEPVEPGIEGNVLFSDSFEDGLDAWTLVDADGDGYSYETADASQFETPDIYDGDVMVMSASYINNVGALNPDNWMISPAIDLSDAADDATVSVFAKGQDPSYASEVFAIYAGTSADNTTMTQIGGNFTATGAWAQYTASLADFVGEEEVYIAIRHYNVTDMFYLDLDLVQVLDNLTEGEPEAHAVVNSGFNKAVESVNKNVPAKSYEARTMQVAKLGDGFCRADAMLAPTVIEMTKIGETANEVAGGTNAIKGELVKTDLRALVDETVAENGEVSIVLTEDEVTANGLIKVAYNPEILTFAGLESDVELFSFNEAEGVITFAYAATEEIEAGTALATVKFTYTAETVDTEVTVTTVERYDDVEVKEDALVIPIVIEEPVEPVDYKLADSVKDGDVMVIYNPLGGMAVSNADYSEEQPTYRAGVAVEPVEGVVSTADSTIVWTAVAVEGGYQLVDGEGHKLSMANKGLELDKENDVWEIRRLEANKFAIVNVNAAPGNSGDPKALEWYTKYSEFSTHYLNTTDGQFIFELYIKDYEPAHEHAYGEPVWTWNEDLTAATATFTCECGDKQVLDATITEEVVTEAAPHVAGEKKLTAKVTFNGTDYTDEKSVEIEALPCPCADFEDMPEYGTVEHDAIDWAYTHEPEQITNGMDSTHFGPERTVTRAQAVTFLWRQAGCPAPTTTENPFTDVKEKHWFYQAVLWAVENEITNGTSATTFSPNKTCTIEQIITFIYRAKGEPEVSEDVVNPYTDVKPSHYFYNAAMWALENGIYAGKDETTFGRGDDCKRVEIVTFLYRYETGKGLTNTPAAE